MTTQCPRCRETTPIQHPTPAHCLEAVMRRLAFEREQRRLAESRLRRYEIARPLQEQER
jgi:hypothetical protein